MDKFIGSERRRQADRRSSNRPGKYERRKNVCGTCAFYQPQSATIGGMCRKHQVLLRASDYACVWYTQKLEPDTDVETVNSEE